MDCPKDCTEKLVANGHEASSAVIESLTAHREQMPVNIGESHELVETVPTGQDEKWRAQQELNLPKKGVFL